MTAFCQQMNIALFFSPCYCVLSGLALTFPRVNVTFSDQIETRFRAFEAMQLTNSDLLTDCAASLCVLYTSSLDECFSTFVRPRPGKFFFS